MTPGGASGTHREAQHLVVLGVHGLSLLCVAGVIVSIEGDPSQLKNDVPLGLDIMHTLKIVSKISHIVLNS